MEDTQWNSLVIEINEYLEADDTIGDSLRQVVVLNLQIGEENASERDSAHGALKALLKGRAGSPLGRKGKKPSVPASVRVSIDKLCKMVEEAALAYYNYDSVIGSITFARKGLLYDSAEAYAKSVVKTTRTKMAKRFKDGLWDGTLESLLSDSEEE